MHVKILDLSGPEEAPRSGELQHYIRCCQAGQVCTAFVDEHPIRHTIFGNGLLEKPAGSSQILSS